MIKVYENELYTRNGKFYTENFIKHFDEENLSKYQKIDKWDIPAKSNINCCYNEIFDTDSSLLLCNNITEIEPYLYENLENGECYNVEDDAYEEVYQFYLIDYSTADYLRRATDELIFYSEKLGLYVLGVTHWGTSWDYVEAEFTTLI